MGCGGARDGDSIRGGGVGGSRGSEREGIEGLGGGVFEKLTVWVLKEKRVRRGCHCHGGCSDERERERETKLEKWCKVLTCIGFGGEDLFMNNI